MEKLRQQKFVYQPKPPTQEQGFNPKYGQTLKAYLKWTKYILAYLCPKLFPPPTHTP